VIKDWATEIGINLQLALAGFWGGVVSSLVLRKASFVELFSVVLTGMMTANYLGAVAVKYTGAPELATGFIVGLSGMVVCRGIITGAQSIRFSGSKGSKDAQP
jgi:hypothetical protein